MSPAPRLRVARDVRLVWGKGGVFLEAKTGARMSLGDSELEILDAFASARSATPLPAPPALANPHQQRIDQLVALGFLEPEALLR